MRTEIPEEVWPAVYFCGKNLIRLFWYLESTFKYEGFWASALMFHPSLCI